MAVAILKITSSIFFLASGLICTGMGILGTELFFVPVGTFLLLIAYLVSTS